MGAHRRHLPGRPGRDEIGRRRPLVALPENGRPLRLPQRLSRDQHGHRQLRGRRRRREDVDSVDPHAHLAVRGLFGIEPALHEGRLDICPAFPSAWREASIRTPDVSYTYRRQGEPGDRSTSARRGHWSNTSAAT